MASALDLDALRRDLRARRAALSPAFRLAAAEQVGARLRASPLMPSHGCVAGYWAVGGEIALHAWQSRLPAEITYCLPVLAEDGRLRFAPWRPGEPLVTNRFGIPEPDVPQNACVEADDLALAVVPLVGFDANCNRLGMGGGWYDRTFARRRGGDPPRLVGAAYDLQRVEALSPAAWDVPLDAVCTESTTYSIA
ncbi:5-formyltetrahydrofolate cyclo-ligase [Lysobacter humi (ex Lee et al. 2017)]